MTQTMRPIPADGTPLAADAGTSHKVNLIRTIENGFTLYVTSGPNTIHELSDSFTDETLARHAARTVCVRLNRGESIHTLIAEKQATEQDLIAAVNATMDEATNAYVAPRQRDRQAASEVNTGWDRFADRRRVNTRPITRRPLTDLMTDALASANDAGEIRVQDGVSVLTLRALAERRLGRLVTDGQRRRIGQPAVIVKLQLNLAGLKAAAEIGAQA